MNPTLTFPAGLPHVTAQLVIASPTAPAGLDTERIALSRAPLSLDYFADAQWADRMPFLVQTALVEGFEKSAAIPAVGPDNGGLSRGFRAGDRDSRFRGDLRSRRTDRRTSPLHSM